METNKEIWILYQTTNVCNGKIYVGVHKLADTSRSKQYLGSGNSILSAIKKYGRNSFSRETLAEFDCFENAYAAEAEMVTEEFIKRSDTYNISLGGWGGVNLTKEMRIKIGKANKGKVLSAEHKAKLIASNRGRPMSEENKEKLRAVNKGRVISDETKEKVRMVNTGNKYCLGRKNSEKSNVKNRISQPASVSLVINSNYYASATVASQKENVTTKTVLKRARSNDPKWAKWRLATEEEKLQYNACAL
jgi:hypothetical protein